MDIRGSLVALVTPMGSDGAVDDVALARLVEFHIEAGTAGLVVAGTTGESPTLTADEHAAYVDRAVALADGRIPVIAGTGSNSTRQSLALSRRAAESGVDGLMLVVPYYNKPPQEGLYQHFRAVAEAVELPVILYNVPGRTACDLMPETVARLVADVPNIRGLKDATAEVGRVAELRASCGEDFRLYSGDDATGRAFMLAGGDGVISVTANVVPAAMAAMCRAALAGEEDEAAALDDALAGLHRELFCQANPIPVKWALGRMGMLGDGIRLPLIPLENTYHGRVAEATRRAGVEIDV